MSAFARARVGCLRTATVGMCRPYGAWDQSQKYYIHGALSGASEWVLAHPIKAGPIWSAELLKGKLVHSGRIGSLRAGRFGIAATETVAPPFQRLTIFRKIMPGRR